MPEIVSHSNKSILPKSARIYQCCATEASFFCWSQSRNNYLIPAPAPEKVPYQSNFTKAFPFFLPSCMYLCIYVCMYVCMYVCVCVCVWRISARVV